MEDKSIRYYELEPALLEDNTECKVPVTPSSTDDSILNCGQGDQGDNYSNDIVEYSRLVDLYRELPADLFVPRILKDYASCEQSLEQTRVSLFENIRSCDDYPYGLQCELKRRVSTRKGDPVCVKLANDIHVLLSVLEGDDFGLVKELLSTSRARSSSQSRQTSDVSASERSSHKCQCVRDLSFINDSISGMQSEMLLIRQQLVASEAARSEQLQTLTDTIVTVKCDLNKLLEQVQSSVDSSFSLMKAHIARELSSVGETLSRHGSSLSFNADNRVFAGPVEDQPPLNSDSGLHLQLSPDSMLTPGQANESDKTLGNMTIPTGHEGGGFDVALLEQFLSYNEVHLPDATTQGGPATETANADADTRVDTDSDVNTDVNADADTDADVDVETETYSATRLQPGTGQSCVTAGQKGPPSCGDGGTASTVDQSIQTSEVRADDDVICAASKGLDPPSDSHHTRRTRNKPARKVTFADIVAKIGTPSEPRVNGIPVRVTDRDNHSDTPWEPLSEEDFSIHVRKRSKRFFIGGFKNTMTIPMIKSYVSSRGPRVTMVRCFQSKRSADDVIFRVNVECNDDIGLVEQRGFWPRGVSCKPWLSRGALRAHYESDNRRRYDRRTSEGQWHSNPAYIVHECDDNVEYDDVYHSNRYDLLGSDVD